MMNCRVCAKVVLYIENIEIDSVESEEEAILEVEHFDIDDLLYRGNLECDESVEVTEVIVLDRWDEDE